MESRKKQIQLRQKAQFEQKMKDRLALLAGKGIEPPKSGKDPIVRKIHADIKAVNNRLRRLAENDKLTETLAKAKADKAAAALKAKESGEPGKAEKPKKAEHQPKEKKEKAKPEKKPAPPKAPEGGQGEKPA
jgi:hypothetical protein